MNLDITYTKAATTWFSETGPQIKGDEGVRFQAAFVALQGCFFLRKQSVSRLILH